MAFIVIELLPPELAGLPSVETAASLTRFLT
jgi:hypothetical protein